MKKTVFALCMLACTAPVAAQDISSYLPGEDEGIVYFLPKTALDINVIATHVTYQPGELCQYANQYLRINNVNTQPETHWEIKQIEVRSAGVPDSTKAYIIKLKDKSAMSQVELTNDGLIKAINTSAPERKAADYILEQPQKHENPRRYMTEDILLAGSSAKMAELTAKEIYNIRESKNLILRGQADAMPKDGTSLQLVIDNLNKQEKALTQLFTGTTDREDKLFTFRIGAEEPFTDKVALRFSRLLGILPAEDLAGDPVYISLKSISPLPPTSEEKGKKKKKLEGAIYNIPGKGKVDVTFQGKTYFEDELPVTQFGTTEVLVEDLFKKVNTRVIFNPETGSILKIDKD